MDYDKNFVGVTQKVFAVLESLSQQPKAGVSLDEITSLSGLPKTTVHRLLYSMNKLEYVEQDSISIFTRSPGSSLSWAQMHCLTSG